MYEPIQTVTTEMTAASDRERVLALLRVHGWNSTSFQVLKRGFSYWFDPEVDACVAYVDTGKAWVAAGAPISSESDLARTAQHFIEAAANAARRVCFFAVEDRLIRATNHRSMSIGQQPHWEPGRWQSTVTSSRNLREQLRRARAKGLVVRSVPAAEMADLATGARRGGEELIEAWLESRKMAPMGFLVSVQPFDRPEERRYWVAERDGRVEAMLVAVPVYARRGWLLEDLLRRPSAPNGTMELLIHTAMTALDQESDYVTLGIAPLAGHLPAPMRAMRSLSRALYDFDGLRRFRAKLQPSDWTPILLAWPRGSGAMALYDSLAAFTTRPRGEGATRARFIGFGVETVLRSQGLAMRRIGLLFVAWAASLLVARCFSSVAVLVVAIAGPLAGGVSWAVVRRARRSR